MSELYTFPEGTLHLYTGTATASALVAYARRTELALTRGWDSRPSLSGLYRDHLTGQRADLTVQAALSNDFTLMRFFESATAVHAHLRHSGANGSAGVQLYSGRLESLALVGGEDSANVYRLQMRFPAWSAYGGSA